MNPTTATSVPSVIIFTRANCCLCHDAEELLKRYGMAPVMVDIDRDPELQKRFTECVPVVQIDGVIRFRGRVNEVLLRRLVSRKTD